MTTIVSIGEIESLLLRQLQSFFPISDDEKNMIGEGLPLVISRCDKCFSKVENKYYNREGQSFFSPYHSGQWLSFLYFLSNTLSVNLNFNEIYSGLNKTLSDKIYYLNKIMHSVDVYHEVLLPDVFFFEHPVGTVLGRAEYKDGFMAYQNCTVGGNKGHYPILGRNFRMMSGSKVLGRSKIGDNVTLGANAYVKDTDIPDGVTVFGQFPNLTLKYL